MCVQDEQIIVGLTQGQQASATKSHGNQKGVVKAQQPVRHKPQATSHEATNLQPP